MAGQRTVRVAADRRCGRFVKDAACIRFEAGIASRRIERCGKPGEVRRRGEPSAMGIHGLDAEAAIRFGDFGGERGKHARNLAVIGRVITHFALGASAFQGSAQPHSPDAHWGQHLLAHELPVGPAAEPLDHTSEQAVAKVGIGIAGAGVEIKGLAQHVPDDRLWALAGAATPTARAISRERNIGSPLTSRSQPPV